MNTITLRRGIELGMAMLLATTVAISSQMDQKLSRQQNADALRKYTWKSRTEIQKGGETRSVELTLMRYDIDGTLQKTILSSTPQKQLPTRGIRGLIAQRKKENFLETLDELGNLAKSYSELPPDVMQRFRASATITPEAEQKLIRIKGSNVLQSADSMTLWVDARTHKQRKAEIRTALEGKPVRIVSDFQDLPAGPTFMARSVVEYPGEELRVITENFDYERATR
ncbi:MAG: hypothetical protein AB1631_14665 [Acidobacteriota bacterium]